MKYYSPSTNGFYAPGIHDEDKLPIDVIELTDEAWMSLLDAQSQGAQIVSRNGKPFLVPPATRSKT